MMIAGNHEFYNNSDIAAQGDSWQKMFLPNVGYYRNRWYFYSFNLRIPAVDESSIQNDMNDYSQILYNKRRLIPQNINDEFEKNIVFIQRAVRESDAEKIVVVTHDLPTFSALEQRQAGDD